MTRLASLLALVAAAPALAEAPPVTAEIRTGWRQADGTHMAALHLRLAPGWKTYWRAPGDAGIPPSFDWSGSDNLASVAPVWPTPEVFYQSGMRSVGYAHEMILPLRLGPRGAGDIGLEARIDLGVCSDICVPYTLNASATLPAGATARDPVITAALVSRPFSAAEASAGEMRCTVAQTADGLELTAEVELDALPGVEATVLEVANPNVWVSEPETSRSGGRLTARAELAHVSGQPVGFDRKGVTLTVIGAGRAVEIAGCGG